MTFTSGLVLLTSPVTQLLSRIGNILKLASHHVERTLYIHIDPGFGLGKGRYHLPFHPDVKRLVHGVYCQSAALSGEKDIRILLGNISNTQDREIQKYHLHKGYQVVFAEDNSGFGAEDFLKYAMELMPVQNSVDFRVLETHHEEENESNQISARELPLCNANTCKSYDHVVLGGTFDRLHIGHKILLSEALLVTEKSLTVGVTSNNMNQRKTLYELILPEEERISDVHNFLNDVKPGIQYNVVQIEDPFGPSITDPDLQCIVVSQETLRGGEACVKKRLEKGLSKLDIAVVDLIEDVNPRPGEETKISSSSARMRMLGKLIRPPLKKAHRQPYVIGMTGGIASGKSSICKRLAKLGAHIVDCDKLGHIAYKKGTTTHDSLIDAFGSGILTADGEIDRRALGAIVFTNPNERQRLNQIVWPAIKRLAKYEIEEQEAKCTKVVILDAAVLLEAGWQELVNEVWISMIPKEEAVRRLKERNHLNEDEAMKRINSQITNSERVSQANLVFSTLWDPEITQTQVERAWSLLNTRI